MLCLTAQFDYIMVMSDPAKNLGTYGAQFRIGRLPIHGRAIVAPMARVTDLGMRGLAQRFGAAFTVSEKIALDPLCAW
jgi:hypothetical protein